MRCLLLVCAVAVTLAEPPSNRYLPPSGRSGYNSPSSSYGAPGGAQGGAPGGLPQIVAARSGGGGFGQSGYSGGLARSKSFNQLGSPQARFSSPSSSYGAPAERSAGYAAGGGYGSARSGLDDAEPANYNFEYMVSDESHGTEFGHHEVRQEERAEGEYHVVLPDGRKQTVNYEADEHGFKPKISYEESDLARSGGYDFNAQNLGRSSGYDSNSQFRSNGYQGGRSGGY